MRTNVEGTRSLMREAMAAGVERIVYTSSVATLGLKSDGTPADEDTPDSPGDIVGPYKRSKYEAEQVVRRMVADDGLPAVIVNPSTPVGPRDVRPTPTGRIIVEAASGRMPAYVDTGSTSSMSMTWRQGTWSPSSMAGSVSAISWAAIT